MLLKHKIRALGCFMVFLACNFPKNKSIDLTLEREFVQECQANIRIINRLYPDEFFYLHDSYDGLGCNEKVDSVQSLHGSFRFLELKQSIGIDPLFWCRDSFDYEIVSFDHRKVVMLQCSDSIGNNEVQFFNYLDAFIYPDSWKWIDRQHDRMRQLRADSLVFKSRELYSQKKRFLDEYVQRRPVSDEFYKFCQLKFLLDYHEALYMELKYSRQKNNLVRMHEMKDTLLKYRECYQQDQFLFATSYKLGCYSYNCLLAQDSGRKEVVQLESFYNSAVENFTGKTKDMLLFWIYGQMIENGEADTSKVNFDEDCEDEGYKEEIREKRQFRHVGNQGTGNDLAALDKTLLPFNEMVKRHSGKLVYVDFWASWCAPCRKAFVTSRNLQEKYKNEDVVFAYVSIDKDYTAWKKASEAEGLNQIPDNYCVLKATAILKDFKIKAIPRYMLYDRTGKLIMSNAPHPNSPEIRTLFNKYLE